MPNELTSHQKNYLTPKDICSRQKNLRFHIYRCMVIMEITRVI